MNSNDEIYKQKYLKYKMKYLELKQKGGVFDKLTQFVKGQSFLSEEELTNICRDNKTFYIDCVNNQDNKKLECPKDNEKRKKCITDTKTNVLNNNKKLSEGRVMYDYNIYEGKLNNGVRNGFGKMMYPDGSVYTGEWLDNQRHGTGEMIYEFNRLGDEGNYLRNTYKGDWYNDKKNGKGIYFNRIKPLDKYDGEWQNDVKYGKGKQTFSNGDKYEGAWRNNEQNGYGVYTYKSGAVSEGEFVNGRIKIKK